MVDWLAIRSDPIEAVEHGVIESDQFFESTHVGPRSFKRIDYPVAEVLPRRTERVDETNWRHEILVDCWFVRSRDLDYIEDVLHPVAAVLDNVLTALETLPSVTNYHPSSVQDFAGELDNTQVLAVEITFQCVTAIDPDF